MKIPRRTPSSAVNPDRGSPPPGGPRSLELLDGDVSFSRPCVQDRTGAREKITRVIFAVGRGAVVPHRNGPRNTETL